MLHQRTLKSIVRTVGIGLHSGRKVTLVLKPAPVDTGIVFIRSDVVPPVEIQVNALAVGDTRLASVLQKDGVRVSTVEHLMSACAGLGVDNLYVEVDAEEIPIMDGSAATFVFLLRSAGLQPQRALKTFMRVTKTVLVKNGDKWARLDPFFGFKMQFSIDFHHPAIDRSLQTYDVDLGQVSYEKDIARARTFGFAHEVETMREMGLARGGSMDNAIVLDEFRVLNNDGLRDADEFVKHKTLDAIGDLYLIGHPLLTSYSAYKSGHGLNNALLREALITNALEKITFDNDAQSPKSLDFGWAQGILTD